MSGETSKQETHPTRTFWKVTLGFLIVNCIWSSTYLAIRVAVETMPPFYMAGTRFLIAGFIILLLSKIAGARFPKGWQEWRLAMIMGVLLIMIGNGVVSHAEVYLPSNLAALLVSTSALWMAWLGSLGEKGQVLSLRVKTGLIVGLAGVAIMFWPGKDFSFEHAGAQASILFSSMCWALGTIYFRNQSKSLNPFMFAAAQMLCGGAFLLIVSVIAGEWQAIEYSRSSLLAWSYLIVFGSCVAFACYVWLIDKVTSATLATVAYITPIVAAILGWLVLDEAMTAGQLAGMAVIILGVVLVTVPRRPAAVRRFY